MDAGEQIYPHYFKKALGKGKELEKNHIFIYTLSTITYELCNFTGKNRKVKWGNGYCFANTVHFLFRTEGGERARQYPVIR